MHDLILKVKITQLRKGLRNSHKERAQSEDAAGAQGIELAANIA